MMFEVVVPFYLLVTSDFFFSWESSFDFASKFKLEKLDKS
jgi:hypothetical protein